MLDRIQLTFAAKESNKELISQVIKTIFFRKSLEADMHILNELIAAANEAVNNVIFHAYPNKEDGEVSIEIVFYDGIEIEIIVDDFGIGMEDIEKCCTPLYTTKDKEQHAGLGFTMMEAMTDNLKVDSCSAGTTIRMTKRIG